MGSNHHSCANFFTENLRKFLSQIADAPANRWKKVFVCITNKDVEVEAGGDESLQIGPGTEGFPCTGEDGDIQGIVIGKILPDRPELLIDIVIKGI